ncbi:zona pellucida sperm-binding protein 3-like [Nelusetta ayraudi]|uniref:zona pellucida sperm-binding protein 3-like n=1 Tax=Nelusetta ayraudi TaxID=303726 RepID=UPI003F72BF92
MLIVGHFSYLQLLFFLFSRAESIRPLKQGRMIDAEGREYKSPRYENDKVERTTYSQVNGSSPVHIECTDSFMIVEVNPDQFKKGSLASFGELFLGGPEYRQSSECHLLPAADGRYVIKVKLQECGSESKEIEDYLIYSNKLFLLPAPRHHNITRIASAVIAVACHYKRKHLVSSHPQQMAPTGSIPKQQSDFSLQLMTDDWKSDAPTSVFYLGDTLHLQASYTGPESERRRLFIDSCVATLSPDATSVPRYYFIENHGCLIDAKLGGSDSLFRQRHRANLLRLQLNIFLFNHDPRNSIFITCQLKVVSEMWQSNPINKACNYANSRWKSLDGYGNACQCCDSICSHHQSPVWKSQAHKRGPAARDTAGCVTVTLGPLMIFPRK